MSLSFRDLVERRVPIQLKQDLGLPQSRPSGVQDLPVAALFSADARAFRALVEAQTAAEHDDWESAERNFARAVELDSTFALAHYALYQTRLVRGDAQGSIPSLDAAMRYLYRMPERSQFIVKADHYFMRQDMDKAFAVVNMMVELYPDDVQGHAMRAQFQILRDDRTGAIESLRRMLALDPQRHETLLQIGSLQEADGAFQDAIATYEEYADAFPNDVDAWLRVARAHKRVGALESAREAADRAQLVEPTHVEAMLERAILHRDAGESLRAQRLIDDAAGLARTAEDRARVEAARQTFYESLGQHARMLEAMRAHVAAIAEFLPPMQRANSQMSQLGMYVRAGRTDQALAQLEEVRNTLNAPLDDMWRIGQLEVAIAARDTTILGEAIAGVKRLIAQFNFNFLASNIARGEATLLETRGDWAGALTAWQQVRQVNPASSVAGRDVARVLRHLGRFDEAQRAVDEHLRVVPFGPETNLEAARIRLAAGDTAGARPYLDRVAHMYEAADPGHPGVIELREMLASLAAR